MRTWIAGLMTLFCCALYTEKSAIAELVYVPNQSLTREETTMVAQTVSGMIPFVNTAIVNTPRIEVRGERCGQPNAFYRRSNAGVPTIILCTELFRHVVEGALRVQTSRERREVIVISQLIFVFMHEVGHALIDVLDIPSLGREEDAADQFATLMLESAPHVVLYSLAFWLSSSRGTAPYNASAFAGEHSLNEQRVYNMLCWAYGADPLVRHEFARLIPENRRARCSRETNDVTRAWVRLLGAHLVSPWGTVPNRRTMQGTWRFAEQIVIDDNETRCTASGTVTIDPFVGGAGRMEQAGTCVHQVRGPFENAGVHTVEESVDTDDGFRLRVGECVYDAKYFDETRLAVRGRVTCGSGSGNFFATR